MRTNVDFFIEKNGVQTDSKLMVEKAKEAWKNEGNLVKDISSLEIFYKPDEDVFYYLINKEFSGHSYL